MSKTGLLKKLQHLIRCQNLPRSFGCGGQRRTAEKAVGRNENFSGQKAASDVLATVTTGTIKRLLIASPPCSLSIFSPFYQYLEGWMRNAGTSLSTGPTKEPVGESVLHFQEQNHKFNERSRSSIVRLLP